LLAAQQKAGTQALVCHVLRYAPAFLKVKEILDSGKIGRLISIDALERVGSWHQAHSYVRGNWRTTEQPCGSAPMILAKCCHDLDLLQYYIGSKCTSISSVGDLAFFKEENAPKGSAKRCVDCAVEKDCPYSAKHVYLTLWENQNRPEDQWPFNIITNAPLTREKLEAAVKEGPYGRCVFHCDNNVVDHQQTLMSFENGVKATLTMTAFTYGGGRRYTFYCSLGQMILDEFEGKIFVACYEQAPEIISLVDLTENGYGHGGGDKGLISQLYDMLAGNSTQTTSLEASVESHLMGICAEESRLKGGELIYIHK
jgi:predicted dehydrogenase